MTVTQTPATRTPPRGQVQIFPAEGAELTGRLHHPGGTPRAAVVLHGATGVPQSFYKPFAEWLCRSRGMAVLTYDYRGVGASAKGSARRSRATMADWGLRDQPAAQAALERLVPGVPVWAIGHSVGGYMMPFHAEARRLARIITVASGPVHLRDHPWPYRALATLFWYGPGAAAVALAGYLPGRIFGLGPNLPSGVYWQWRRWCTRRGFYRRDIGRRLPVPDWKAITAPLRIVALEDDVMVPPAAVHRLASLYPAAAIEERLLRPVEFGLSQIGHIGAFAPRARALWPALVD
ncbi:hypothetical protein DDZ14_11165 [Maritimibacter sp. 55A14]|uniref:alpha/beta hydrolase family protein n=1 Tax=Maritimibacter sp. 55A14 TaxID=2174844 RepID=UPI000D61567C|nr:alpha/beta fold hydrolase [Maritimibacter sp. 55A14]PWE32282.1 hypothetical protein DDZ14_11165 [Maritimibacter sp. 55A14]